MDNNNLCCPRYRDDSPDSPEPEKPPVKREEIPENLPRLRPVPARNPRYSCMSAKHLLPACCSSNYVATEAMLSPPDHLTGYAAELQ